MQQQQDSPRHAGDEAIAAIRAFNRFYTARLGVLEQHMLDSPYSLAEARLLYELSQRDRPTAKEIGTALGLDAGYLSRMVQSFEQDGLIKRTPSPADRRAHLLTLTAKGRTAAMKLDQGSQDHVAAMLAALAPAERPLLTAAMATILRLLSGADDPASPTLREPWPGDIGWVVQSHAAAYAAEYGFDASFEALVAQIAGQYLATRDAGRERCWIAEYQGVQAGSVFLVRGSDEVAKLRLLFVTPEARGHGLGRRLVDEAIGFARATGYRKITLWTQSILTAARAVYQQAGFVRVASEPHAGFGYELIGETWELEL